VSSKTDKKAKRLPQIKVTIPRSHQADVAAAMEFDGITKASQFALAAILQRVRRIKQLKAQEEKTPPR
jgi:hypothetical protein